MAFDTKYRPSTYSDVIGQDAIIAVLKQFVQTGSGFHQSYLFCGQFGSGKTTTARILARALLCDNPVGGEPCDQCNSCKEILRTGGSESFHELDAATKSGKDNITQITEDLSYSTFSGKRRIYLFDEAHQLSKQALDALLKPLEDTVSGTEDKQLVCIFCTTEPEKMRATVFSRCAPAFVIQAVTPAILSQRLAWVCEQENLPFEIPALELISESVECHIRDALKALESVSMMKEISLSNVKQFLKADTNDLLVDVLFAIGEDLPTAVLLIQELSKQLAPSTIYEKLLELCMLAYSSSLGVAKIPGFWDAEKVQQVASTHGDFLIAFANYLSKKPYRVTKSMLTLDLAQLHQLRLGSAIPIQGLVKKNPTLTGQTLNTCGTITQAPKVSEAFPDKAFETPSGVYIEPRAIKKKTTDATQTLRNTLTAEEFGRALRLRYMELVNAPTQRSERPPDMGGDRTHPSG